MEIVDHPGSGSDHHGADDPLDGEDGGSPERQPHGGREQESGSERACASVRPIMRTDEMFTGRDPVKLV